MEAAAVSPEAEPSGVQAEKPEGPRFAAPGPKDHRGRQREEAPEEVVAETTQCRSKHTTRGSDLGKTAGPGPKS